MGLAQRILSDIASQRIDALDYFTGLLAEGLIVPFSRGRLAGLLELRQAFD